MIWIKIVRRGVKIHMLAKIIGVSRSNCLSPVEFRGIHTYVYIYIYIYIYVLLKKI